MGMNVNCFEKRFFLLENLSIQFELVSLSRWWKKESRQKTLGSFGCRALLFSMRAPMKSMTLSFNQFWPLTVSMSLPERDFMMDPTLKLRFSITLWWKSGEIILSCNLPVKRMSFLSATISSDPLLETALTIFSNFLPLRFPNYRMFKNIVG